MAIHQTSSVALLVLLLSAVCSGIPRKKVLYYISPSHGSPCPVSSCLTLSQFANSSSHYLASETTLSFLPGNHSFRSRLLIANIIALAMISTHSNASITCNLYGMFQFNRVDIVNIKNIHSFGCTGHKLLVSQFVLESSMFNGAQGGSADVFTILTGISYIKDDTLYTTRVYNQCNITIAYSQLINSYDGLVLRISDFRTYIYDSAKYRINISNSRIIRSAHGVLFAQVLYY